MDRRTALGIFGGRQREKQTQEKTTNSSAFAPYTGTWKWELAAHLLRRTTFGPTKTQISQALDNGMEATIDLLFEAKALPDPPVYYDFENDPNVPLGQTWVDTLETPNITGLNGARKRSFLAWCFQQMKEGGTSINEKMLLFWQNHFVVANTNTGRRMYTYLDLLRKNVLGNFRTLVEGMTIDTSMLRYLNGTDNSVSGPNENYARELLELFTIGKGPIAAPGDYTNYTEEDIVEMAKALTGWRHFNADNNNEPTEAGFVANRHDTTDKQLSHRFDNQVVSNENETEYKTVIDIILQKDEVARFICRKLYRWFVHSEITSEVESEVIEPMAQMMLANNYEVAPPLRALLSSQHFYETTLRGCMVAHPIEHWFKLVNTFEVELPQDFVTAYKVYKHFHYSLKVAEMAIHEHPTVAGWKAFYQAPQYDKLWINAVSLPLRQQYTNRFIRGYNNNGFHLKINVLEFAASLTNPVDPNDLVNEIASILFAHPLTATQVLALKNVLIPGLPDFEWTVEYGDYIGGNTSLEEAVEKKLQALIGTMANMPEFMLI